MTITPDTKDWTWVLERPCDECGFDGRSIARENVGTVLRANLAEWRSILAGDPAAVAQRPRPDVWSALEYGCHVRDVFRLYRYRLGLMLAEDGARFVNWDQDATAVEERYDEADPATVSAELAEAGDALADAFDAVAGDQWARTGHRSDGATFTIDTFARYLVHDPVHHVHDVRRAW